MANTISGNGTITIPWSGGTGKFVAISDGLVGYNGATVSLQTDADEVGGDLLAMGSNTTFTADGGGIFIAGKEDIYIVTTGYANDINYKLIPVEGKNI